MMPRLADNTLICKVTVRALGPITTWAYCDPFKGGLIMRAIAILALLCCAGYAHAIPEEIANDPQALHKYFKELEARMDAGEISFYDYMDEWNDMSTQIARAVRRLEEAELEQLNQARLDTLTIDATGTDAGQVWAQKVGDFLVSTYYATDPDAEATDASTTTRAASGESLLDSREHYAEEIGELQQSLEVYQNDLNRAITNRNNLQTNLDSYIDSRSIWESLDFASDDSRKDYLVAQIAKADEQILFLRGMTAATYQALNNTITAAGSHERTLTLTAVKSDAGLLKKEEEFRFQEAVALTRELNTTHLQFVEGQAGFDAQLQTLDQMIARQSELGYTDAAEKFEKDKEYVIATHELWIAGIQTEISAQGSNLQRAFNRNAAEGVGPQNQTQLISQIAGCGDSPMLVLEGRDPQTREIVDEDIRWSVDAATQSATGIASGAAANAPEEYTWRDFAYDYSDEFYVSFKNPRIFFGRYGSYWEGVGNATYDAAHGLYVIGAEAVDTVGEAGEGAFGYYTGVDTDVFGRENLDTLYAIPDSVSGISGEGIYDGTQSVLSWMDRRIEIQAGSGEQGLRDALEDFGYVTGTVGTFVAAPEVMILKATSKGAQAGKAMVVARVMRTGDRAAEATGAARVVSATAEAGAVERVAGAAGDAINPLPEAAASLPPGQIPAHVAEAATPLPGARPPGGGRPVGDLPAHVAEAATPVPGARPPGGGGAPLPSSPSGHGMTVDVAPFGDLPGGPLVVTRTDGGSLVLAGKPSSGGFADFYSLPGREDIGIKVIQAGGTDLDALGHAALEALDPGIAAAPRVIAEYPITTVGRLEGGVVQVVQKAPPSFASDAARAIKTAAGDMTPGQVGALNRATDALADTGWVMADIKADNFTFLRGAGPDEWIPVFFDFGGFVKMKTPEAAHALKTALQNPPTEFLTGPWAEARIGFQNRLAERFNPLVDWAEMERLTGQPYRTLSGGLDGFPYNPRIGEQFPAIRLAEGAAPVLPPLTTQAAGGASTAAGQAAAAGSGFPVVGHIPPLRRGSAVDAAPQSLGVPAERPPLWGVPPRWLQEMGVDRMPGFLGRPPGKCEIGPAAGAAEEASSGGWMLHLPNKVPVPPNLTPFIDFTFGADDYGVAVLDMNEEDARGAQLAFSGLFFEPDPYSRLKQTGPDDPYFNSRGSWGQNYDDQWALKRIGFTAGEDSAWPSTPDAGEPIIVAVVDTGVAWNHRDLGVEHLWINRGELPDNGRDDDGNGYVDDVVGWNFVERNNLPWDLDGHGTLVAGIIAANRGNGLGIAGINPQARIMVLRALDANGRARPSALAEAIIYATDNGARVVNISVGGPQLTRAEQVAVDYAHSKNVLVVAAAGNGSIDVDGYGPGGAEHVLTVAATDTDDRRFAGSNWGARVNVAAPGVDILGLRAIGTDTMANMALDDYRRGGNFVGADKGYFRATGTSFAAPIVAGLASLIISAHPQLSVAQVQRIVEQSARDVEAPGWDPLTGYGRVDARAAMSADPEWFVEARLDGARVQKQGNAVVLELLGTADANRFTRARLERGAGENPEQWQQTGEALTRTVRDGVLFRLQPTELSGSKVWILRMVVEHEDGSAREARYRLNLN